jgi:hypothetical protein
MSESLQRDFGITDVREEDRSETTYENAKYSARILNAAGIDSIYLVTHAANMPRAAEAFKHSGLRVVPAPTGFTLPESLTADSLQPRAKFLDESGRAIHELVGVWFYRLIYAVGKSSPAASSPALPPIASAADAVAVSEVVGGRTGRAGPQADPPGSTGRAVARSSLPRVTLSVGRPDDGRDPQLWCDTGAAAAAIARSGAGARRSRPRHRVP